jgi:A/G-specific adenine glycosylase
MMQKKIPETMISRLMEWFRGHSRDMPWRGSEDPYRIWVSEMMLQQTQVRTVEKYFPRWIERFPDVFMLAEASLEDVLKVWEGLGYYTRARNFHRGAKYIAEHAPAQGSPFPEKYEEWLKVPGVGPYTAAAVSSIAFACPAGVVDGNVLRVMSRLFCEDAAPSSPAFRRAIFDCIGASFYGFHPGWVNQAWMELGSLRCKKVPACLDCPLRENCCAQRKGLTEHYPPKREKKKLPLRRGAAFIIRGKGGTLMVRRYPEGFLGGLWEYPGYTLAAGEAEASGYRREFAGKSGLRVGDRIAEPVRHSYSHFHQHMEIYAANICGEWRFRDWEKARWVSAGEMRELPRTGLAKKIGKALEAPAG